MLTWRYYIDSLDELYNLAELSSQHKEVPIKSIATLIITGNTSPFGALTYVMNA